MSRERVTSPNVQRALMMKLARRRKERSQHSIIVRLAMRI
jgi:hypothetical protein